MKSKAATVSDIGKQSSIKASLREMGNRLRERWYFIGASVYSRQLAVKCMIADYH